MKGIGYIAFAMILWGTVHTGWGQEVSVQASVDRQKVHLKEPFTLRVAVTGVNVSGLSDPHLPPLKGFEVVGNAQSTQISWVNGKMTATQEYSYTLMPREVGTFSIDPVEVRVGNKTFRTRRISVEVVQGAPGGSAPGGNVPTEEMAEASSQDLFIRAEVDKRRVYISEQVTLTFSYYNRMNLWDQPRYTPPETAGFWVEELPHSPMRSQIIQGRVYEVQEIKTALFPTTAGKRVISRAYLDVQTRGFGFFSQPRPRRLATDPIEIEVLPLPTQGKPQTFSGAVGQYTISAALDKSTVHRGDALTLQVKITGTGNIPTVGDPAAPPLDGFKVYTPEVEKSSFAVGEKIQGEKTLRYALIPEVEGDLKIGSFDLSYFNPSRGTYQTVSTTPLRVTVSKGESEPAEPVNYGLSREEIQVVGKDIRFIKPPVSRLKNQSRVLYRSPLFWLLEIVPLLTFGGVALYKSYRTKLASNIVYARRRRAKGEATRRLKQAHALLQANESRAFCGEVHKALSEYLGHKLNLPSAGITIEQVSNELPHRGIEEAGVEEIRDLFGRCDMARFAPMELSREERVDLLRRTEEIIMRLEKEL